MYDHPTLPIQDFPVANTSFSCSHLGILIGIQANIFVREPSQNHHDALVVAYIKDKESRQLEAKRGVSKRG